ncbi:MAG: DMT family transporter [Desulfohalobium sp.]
MSAPAVSPASPVSPKRQLGADCVLLFVALIWGITFTLIKDALDYVSVFAFLSQRFTLAAGLFVPILIWRRRYCTRQALMHGAVLGTCLFGAFAFQTLGLRYTTAANTAFVTGMNVVFVPLFNALLFRVHIPIPVRLGVFCATFGLAALTLDAGLHINFGDLIVLACAVCIALQIIFTGRYARNTDVYWLTAVQIAVVAFLSTGIALARGETVVFWEPAILEALLLCAPLATVFAFWAQTSMQRFTAPSRAALIFCMEPVFGALYACLIGGERLGPWAGLGATGIVCGMLLAEMPEKWWRRR